MVCKQEQKAKKGRETAERSGESSAHPDSVVRHTVQGNLEGTQETLRPACGQTNQLP